MAQRNRAVGRAGLQLTHPNAAGIDIGSASHFVAVPPDRDDEPVREFKSFTSDLIRLADWLAACGVKTVAMESTGVYWIPLFELLESHGFTVLLVNARHVKNVSGRKSDVLDCQWLQQLMTYGLLSGAFRPAEQVCVLRSLWRQRGMLLRSQGRHVQHMQKALTQMNVQLANVIADVVGETGQKILRAIVAGERDGHVLGAMKNVRVKASIDEIAKSLQGNWRPEHLFALKQALDAFDFIGMQVAECDMQIEQQLQTLQVHEGEPANGKKRGLARNAPKFDLRSQLFKMCGVDLTRIDGIDVTTALAVISETGTDMSRFPSDKHFAAHRGLDAGFGQAFAVADGHVLRTPVAMVHQCPVTLTPTRVQRLLQRVEHEVGVHGRADAPADDVSREDIDDEVHVDKALPGRDVGLSRARAPRRSRDRQFRVPPRRTGRAPFAMHPALQEPR
jgi:transposase